MRILLAIAILLSPLTQAATWYLDSEATGANNGTNWANAFTSPSSLTTSVLAPGDVVYVSGGTTSKTYSATLSAVESGSSGSPITYRISQESGHNGVAIFPALSFSSYQWIVFDGGRTNGFSPAVSVFDLTNNIPNMGFRTSRTNGVGVYANGAGGQNNTIRWVEVGPHGTTNNVGDIHGVQFLNLTALTNFLIEYCWVHEIQNDGINHNLTTTEPTTWNALTIRDTLIEETGDDGIQMSSAGITIDRCFIRDHLFPLYNGHPDQIQFAGNANKYLKVTRNIIRNKANSLIIAEHRIEEGGTIGPMLIAGNVLYNERDWTWNSIQAYGATFSAWRPNADVSVVQGFWTNMYVLNNTIYYQLTTPFAVTRAAPDGGTRSVWDLRVNGRISNNLQVDSKYNSSALGSFIISGNGDPGSGTNGVYYATNDLPATHNIVAGPNRSMAYRGLSATNANAHGLNNSTNMPTLSTNDYTFLLSANDTAAKDAGWSLSSLTNDFPELMVDLNGNTRAADGGWDIGALEYTGQTYNTNGLVLWLRFLDDLEDGIATDSSPEANNGLHYGYVNDQVASNRFPSQIVWTNPVTGLTNYGARFWRTNDGWAQYGYSGDYIGFTNLAKIRQMTNASVMLWLVYRPHDDNAKTNYTSVANMRPIGAGYAYRGAWTIGLFGSQYMSVRIYTNDNANADTYTGFGAKISVATSGSYQGYSTNMVHAAFTWNAGRIVTFHNGVPVATNTLIDATTGTNLQALTVRGPAGGLTTGFLSVGGDTHNGNPNLTPSDDSGDQYPNHAFFTGDMADVRIYNRTLSTNEIWQIYSGTETGGGEDPGDPDPPAESGGLSISVGNLTVSGAVQ